METFNNWWDVPKRSVILMVKDRIKNRFGDIGDESNYEDFLPGFIIHEKPKVPERFLEHLGCGFCHHIPWYPRTKDIMKCNDCPTYYCWSCARLLASMLQKRQGNLQPNLDNFEQSHIDCATCMKKTRIHPINSDEREMFLGIVVKCRNSFCEYNDKLIDIQRHMDECKSESYKIGSVLNYLHEEMKRRREQPSEAEGEDIQEFLSTEEFIKAFDQKLMIQYPGTFETKDGFEATKRGTDDSLPVVIKARRSETIGRSPSAYSTPDQSPPRQVPGPTTPPETPIVVRKLQSRWNEASKIPGVPDIRKELNTERDALSRPSTSKETSQSLFWHDPEEELIWSDQEISTEKKLDEDKVAAAGKVSTESNEKLTSKASHGKDFDNTKKNADKPKVRDYGIDSDDEEPDGAPPTIRRSSTTSTEALKRSLPKSLMPAKVEKATKVLISDIRHDRNLSEREKERKIHKRLQNLRRTKAGKLRNQEIKRIAVLEKFIAEKSNPGNAFSLRNTIHDDRIFQANQKLKKDRIKVCAIDVEKCEIETLSGVVQMPIWIVVMDMDANVRINEVVRYPKNSIKNMMTEFHGVTWEIMQGARHIDVVRRKVIDVLVEYDRIIVASGSNDFKSLGFDSEDWEVLQPRIRDVNYYYNCYERNEQIGLKFITFSLFAKIIQEKEHSPLVDAGYTLLAYLVDFEQIEATHQNAIIGIFKPFPQIKYPKNAQMAKLISNIMSLLKDWPYDLKKKTYGKAKPFNPNNLIEPARNLRPPYADMKKEMFLPFVKRPYQVKSVIHDPGRAKERR